MMHFLPLGKRPVIVSAENSSAGILMMEATEEWPPGDAPFVQDRPRDRSILSQRQMSAAAVVVVDTENSNRQPQVRFPVGTENSIRNF